MSRNITGLLLVTALCLGVWANAGPAKAYNIKMRRTDMPDITDVPSTLSSIITDGMSAVEKAKAIWRVVFKCTFNDLPPQELITGCTHDPIKLFNVYGYRMCCCASACNEALANAAGFGNSRTRQLICHNVSEVFYDSGWHMFDSSIITYFDWLGLTGDNIASVDEIHASMGTPFSSANWVTAIYSQGSRNDWNPPLTQNLSNLRDDYNYSTSEECADGFSNGYSTGYRCVLTLREGETLVRSCLNDGKQLHLNGGNLLCRTAQGGAAGEPDGRFFNLTIPDQGGTCYYVHPSYHGGVVGNGTLTYVPDLAGGGYRRGLLSETNIACTLDDGQSPQMHLAVAGIGAYIFRMECPYVCLDGEITATAKSSGAGSVKIHISTNNMRTWTEVWSSGVVGTSTPVVDIGTNINRRYSYFVKIEIASDTATGAGISGLTVANVIQHAQVAMPFLVNGTNQFTVDREGATGTITIEPRLTLDPTFTQNESLLSLEAKTNDPEVNGNISDDGSTPVYVTFPITTPGNMTRLRIAVTYCLRRPGDKMAIQVSTDGTSFTQINERNALDSEEGVKAPVNVEYISMPAGTRNMWVKFIRTGIVNTVAISGHLRIDADYIEAGATQLPFKIKHEWTEGATPMSHTEIVTTTPHTYAINCTAEPTMTAVTTCVEYQDMAPKATLSAASMSLIAGGSVDFTATAWDLNGTIDKYEWDFDGNGSYEYDSGTTGTVKHVFDGIGVFDVKVRVTDNDAETGVSNAVQITVYTDTDGDGMPDSWETTHFGGLSHDGTADGDDDGASDLLEYLANRNPLVADFTTGTDTDSDGMGDIAEFGWFDDLTESGSGDADSDGWTNAQELTVGTDPTNPLDFPTTTSKGKDGGGCGTGGPIAGLLALVVLAAVSRRRQED